MRQTHVVEKVQTIEKRGTKKRSLTYQGRGGGGGERDRDAGTCMRLKGQRRHRSAITVSWLAVGSRVG